MTALIAIMYAAMTLSWACTSRPVVRGSRLKSSLASMNLQVLAAGVILFTALLPALRIGVLAFDVRRIWLLPAVLGAEALICVAMAFIRINWRRAFWQRWETTMQAAILRGDWKSEDPVAVSVAVPIIVKSPEPVYFQKAA